MKKGCIVLVVSCFLFIHSLAFANEKDEKYYVGFSGSMVNMEDANLNHSALSGETELQVITDTDFGFAFHAGKKFKSGFRVEVEIAHRNMKPDKLELKTDELLPKAFQAQLQTLGMDDKNQFDLVAWNFESTSLMSYIYYDHKITDNIFLLAGGGIGIAFLDLDHHDLQGSEATEFAYSLVGGFGYEVTEKIGISLAYKLFATSDMELNIMNLEERPSLEITTHNLEGKITYAF